MKSFPTTSAYLSNQIMTTNSNLKCIHLLERINYTLYATEISHDSFVHEITIKRAQMLMTLYGDSNLSTKRPWQDQWAMWTCTSVSLSSFRQIIIVVTINEHQPRSLENTTNIQKEIKTSKELFIIHRYKWIASEFFLALNLRHMWDCPKN